MKGYILILSTIYNNIEIIKIDIGSKLTGFVIKIT